MVLGDQRLPPEIVLAQRNRRGTGDENIALQEIGAQDGIVVGTASRGVSSAEEQACIRGACGVVDVALYCVVREVDVLKTAHEHLAIATCRLQPAIDNVPIAFAITPLLAETVFKVVGHGMRFPHTALDIVFHYVRTAIDDLYGQRVVPACKCHVLNRYHRVVARRRQFCVVCHHFVVEQQANAGGRCGVVAYTYVIYVVALDVDAILHDGSG